MISDTYILLSSQFKYCVYCTERLSLQTDRQTDKLRQSNQCSASRCKQRLRQNNGYARTSVLW